MRDYSNRNKQNGFSVLEVVIGIFIFVVGMLALAALQGALSRSMADAKLRTTAINLADRAIERQRGFTQLLSAVTPGTPFAYNDIVTPATDPTITREGVTYTIDMNVTDYYYQLGSDTFTTTNSAGVLASDYKQVNVTVSWDTVQDLRGGEGEEIDSGSINTGSVTVTSTIPAIITSASGRVSDESDGAPLGYDVTYQPGSNPDIVKLSLGASKFKESLTPQPKTYRDNLETRFDVVTYSSGTGGSLFLRREEFVAVSCECTLREETVGTKGYMPTIWAGDEYTEPEMVDKPYGEVISNVAQSSLCDRCCRDHHDDNGAGPNAYDPWRPTSEYGEDGNHIHYSKGPRGLTVALPGDDYVEACRFVRKDGFFRLAQDFRLEGLNTFAEDFLITQDQVNDYSDYVTEEVYLPSDATSFVPEAVALGVGYQQHANPPTIDPAPRTPYAPGASGTVADGDLTLGYTTLPTSSNADFQQLRSRSIYVDNLSPDLMWVIGCIETAEAESKDPMSCERGEVKLDQTGSTNILELIPFFEVQTTYLNDWIKETEGGGEYDLTSETVQTSTADGPAHSRGKATKILSNGSDKSLTSANRGVTGVTATEQINELDYELSADIEVVISDTEINVPGRVITGTFRSAVNSVSAADVSMTGTNSTCHHNYSTGVFTCFIPDSITGTPTLTLSGFDKPPKVIHVCSSHQYGSPAELPVIRPDLLGDPKDIDLASAKEISGDGEPYELWLTEDECPVSGG